MTSLRPAPGSETQIARSGRCLPAQFFRRRLKNLREGRITNDISSHVIKSVIGCNRLPPNGGLKSAPDQPSSESEATGSKKHKSTATWIRSRICPLQPREPRSILGHLNTDLRTWTPSSRKTNGQEETREPTTRQ